MASYERMGTTGLAEKSPLGLSAPKVVLMENHGVITIGKTLLEAFDLIEVLENSAKMTFITETMAAGRGWGNQFFGRPRCEQLMQMKYGT